MCFEVVYYVYYNAKDINNANQKPSTPIKTPCTSTKTPSTPTKTPTVQSQSKEYDKNKY